MEHAINYILKKIQGGSP